MSQLHGVETIELTSGSVVVSTIQTAIIGLVVMAPDASASTPASVKTGTLILDHVMDFAATIAGRADNVVVAEAVAGIPDAENLSGVETSAVWNVAALTLTITLGYVP